MSSPVRIQPDPSFVRELQAAGGDCVKKCYQCATCSVACPLSPAENPYPRKEMVWAQWGLKDKLMNDIDVWLCHNCGTCSDLCPRGAKPADTLAAIRNMTYRKLVGPACFGQWMSSAKGLPMLIAIPAIIYGLIWLIRMGGFNLPEGEIKFGKLFPGDTTIDPIFGAMFAFMAWSFYKGVTTMWNSFKSLPETFVIGSKAPKPSLVQAIIDVLRDEIATHRKFNECGNNEERFKGHWALLFGFACLFVVTGIIAVGHWGSYLPGFGWLHVFGDTPMKLYHPVKILAMVGMSLGLYGLVMLTRRRLNLDSRKLGSSFYDWYLLGVVWAVFLTGTGSFLLRLSGVAGLAYPMYYLHLISVFMLITYLPWSKLGHLVYRTTALVYARVSGRLPITREEDKVFEI